jgi:hypothetical protein
MVWRRLWLLGSFCWLACAGLAEAQRLRVMAANITSGDFQSYSLGHGTRIFQGLQPDVVLIQEFNFGTNTSSVIRGWVDTAFGSGFSYYREAGAQIPNGIISRYPILASGEWDDPSVTNRDFAWARIDVPGPKDLWAISVHFLTSSSGVRNTEATNLRAFITANVPPADYLVIGGDFNSDSHGESQFATLSSIVKTSGPHPADRNGVEGTNASREKPYDSVFADPDLVPFQIAVKVGASTFPNGAVVDTRVWLPISEVSPALASDSGAPSMQHMAVVKDFQLPLPADPVVLPLVRSSIRLSGEARVEMVFKSTVGATYEVQASADLSGWEMLGDIMAASAETLVLVVPGPPAVGQVRDRALGSTGRRFYRIARKP